MKVTQQQRFKKRKGFTFIEVIVAVTIFGIISVVIFSVFSSALRSRELSQREVDKLSTARYALDAIEKDLTNIFFRDETSYNLAIASMLEDMEQDRLRAEENDDWEWFYNKWGYPKDEGPKDHQPSVGNPYDRGRIIDLQMQGQDGGDKDTITFAMLDRLNLGGPYRPWGVSRITYRLDNGNLVRKSEAVETNPRNQRGEVIKLESRPLVSHVAGNVKKFDLKYAFWFDNTWFEAKSWVSSDRRTRNSSYILGDHSDLREDARDRRDRADSEGSLTELEPGDPGWNEYINDSDSQPLDRLPAYIRVTLDLADPENSARTQSFQRIIRIYGSEETWTPGRDWELDMREVEQEARFNTYKNIIPAPLDVY